MSEETTQETPVVEETTQEVQKPMSFDDGIIKVNLGELNKPQEDAIQEQVPDASDAIVEQPEDAQSSEAVVEQVQESVQAEESVIEEITNEEVAEIAEDLQEDIQEAIVEQQESGIELPENIQKVVEFMNETGGSLEDYVKLNTDYASLNEGQLLREYYESRPIMISSGYRSPALCEKLGSSKTSQHTQGQAVDFEIPGFDNKEVAAHIKNNFDFDQLISEYYEDGIPDSGWIHVSFKKDGSNRKECLIKDKSGYKVWQ